MDADERDKQIEQIRQRRAELRADIERRRAAGADFEMPRRPSKREVIYKEKADAAVPPPPPFTEPQTKALAAFVQERLDAIVDVIGGEVGTLQRFERERLDSEMTAMRALIEALRSEVGRLRAEVAREVTDSADNVTALKGRSDAA